VALNYTVVGKVPIITNPICEPEMHSHSPKTIDAGWTSMKNPLKCIERGNILDANQT